MEKDANRRPRRARCNFAFSNIKSYTDGGATLVGAPSRALERAPGGERLCRKTGARPTAVAIELQFPNGRRAGSEDVALIDMIRKERSIIGASRALGLSYRKCWLTADALNRCFELPVVATYPGRRAGGAEITQFGERLVALYRSIERHAEASARKSLDELTASLDWTFDPKARVAAPERDLA